MPPSFVTGASPYGLFLKEQLTRTLPTLYKVNYDDLWALDGTQSLHNAIADLPLGLEFFEAYAVGDTGQMAEVYDGLGDDIPVVDVSLAKLPPVRTAIFIQGAWWSEMELERMRTAIASNTIIPTLNVVQQKQAVVADYFNRREHYTALYGYPKKGLYGLFSLRGIARPDNTFTPYKKAAGAYTISTKQLYEDLSDLIFGFMDRARVSSPSQVVMVIPPKLARRLVEVYTDPSGTITGTMMTVRQMLGSTELGMGVTNIIIKRELAGANLAKYVLNESGTGYYDPSYDRIMLKAAGYSLERHYFARTPKPPFQVNSLKYEQVTVGATSGIFNFEPYRVEYFDFKNSET